jgi:DNA-binding CsgD family transcriptional regulator
LGNRVFVVGSNLKFFLWGGRQPPLSLFLAGTPEALLLPDQCCHRRILVRMKALTPRQQEVLEFINRYKFQTPTVREIAKHLALSPSTIHGHMNEPRRKGYLKQSISHNVRL